MSTIFGNRIKTIREEKQIPQRQLASALEIDTATYCKIEKGDRRAKREQVFILSELFEIDSKELIRLWSADKVYDIIAEEEDDVELTEFSDEIDGWVIDEFAKIGLDTARSILKQDVADLVRRTDLEEETILEVMKILKEEFNS